MGLWLDATFDGAESGDETPDDTWILRMAPDLDDDDALCWRLTFDLLLDGPSIDPYVSQDDLLEALAMGERPAEPDETPSILDTEEGESDTDDSAAAPLGA